jgi:CDP-glucose 4,6-dehydratase
MDLNAQLWTGKRVLVTGHTGFKGSWLTLLLQSLGAEVIGLSLPPVQGKSLYAMASIDRFTSREYFKDIRDIDEIRRIFSQIKIDYVFHLAAQAFVRQSVRDPIESISTNVCGASNVLLSALELPTLLGFTFVTTDKVYKTSDQHLPYRETDTLGGNDPYSASKAASEIIASSILASNNPNHIPVTMVRAGNVIGGGDWGLERLVPDLISSMNSNTILSIRNPDATRPWQHVLDCLHGYLLVAESHFKNKNDVPIAFNFGPNTSLSVIELVSQFEVEFKRNIQMEISSSRIKENNWLELNSDLAQSYLGWSTHWHPVEAISRTARWYADFEGGIPALKLMQRDVSDFYS